MNWGERGVLIYMGVCYLVSGYRLLTGHWVDERWIDVIRWHGRENPAEIGALIAVLAIVNFGFSMVYWLILPFLLIGWAATLIANIKLPGRKEKI